MAKIQALTTPNTGKDVEQQELSFVAGGNAKWYTASLEDSLAVSQKTTHTLPIQNSNCVPGIYLNELKRYVHENTCTHGVYNSFIQNCQTLEATKMSFSR